MYPSDLTDEQWRLIELFLQRPDPRGARSKYSKRLIINAIFYVVKGGIQWRMLPKNFPPWPCVYDHFRRLQQRGMWEQICRALNQRVRKKGGARSRPVFSSLIPKA